MAFEWDDAQEKWLERRLSMRAARFETKVRVAGAALFIDAVADAAVEAEFFDFLGPTSLFENKAPSELFDRQELYLCTGRAWLFAYRRRLSVEEYGELTQVVLCSSVTAEVKEEFGVTLLRAGVFEGSFGGIRWTLVEANELDVLPENLAAIVYYATGEKLWEAVEYIVEQEVEEHYVALLCLRREVFKEVLEMKGKVIDTDQIDIRGFLEDFGARKVIGIFGVRKVVDELGLTRVIDEVGLARVIDEVGLARVLDEAGSARVLKELGVSAVLDHLQLEEILRAAGLTRVREALRRLEAEDR